MHIPEVHYTEFFTYQQPCPVRGPRDICLVVLLGSYCARVITDVPQIASAGQKNSTPATQPGHSAGKTHHHTTCHFHIDIPHTGAVVQVSEFRYALTVTTRDLSAVRTECDAFYSTTASGLESGMQPMDCRLKMQTSDFVSEVPYSARNLSSGDITMD